MVTIKIIGSLAALCSLASFVPQAIKTIKTRNTKTIALKTYVIYNTANCLFLLFGILAIALPIMHPSIQPGETQTQYHTEIIIWGITLILPFSITATSVFIIIFIKLQNMKKFGETANLINEKKLDFEVKNNAN